ncbi:hypothetical protein [Isoptericola sp. NPDC019482]|uniref:hypothetical protein n=1 Tax=Isoptericola sp. NPDC019482 TaxID=3154688 RepID=UPI00348AD6BD
MTTFLTLGDDGPESWRVTEHPEWRRWTGLQVVAAVTFWDRFELGPPRDRDGRVVGPGRTIEVPVALRLDVAAAGPVWFVVGIPTEEGGAVLLGDEIMVVFTSEAMLRLGFPAGEFTTGPLR